MGSFLYLSLICQSNTSSRFYLFNPRAYVRYRLEKQVTNLVLFGLGDARIEAVRDDSAQAFDDLLRLGIRIEPLNLEGEANQISECPALLIGAAGAMATFEEREPVFGRLPTPPPVIRGLRIDVVAPIPIANRLSQDVCGISRQELRNTLRAGTEAKAQVKIQQLVGNLIHPPLVERTVCLHISTFPLGRQALKGMTGQLMRQQPRHGQKRLPVHQLNDQLQADFRSAAAWRQMVEKISGPLNLIRMMGAGLQRSGIASLGTQHDFDVRKRVCVSFQRPLRDRAVHRLVKVPVDVVKDLDAEARMGNLGDVLLAVATADVVALLGTRQAGRFGNAPIDPSKDLPNERALGWSDSCDNRSPCESRSRSKPLGEIFRVLEKSSLILSDALQLGCDSRFVRIDYATLAKLGGNQTQSQLLESRKLEVPGLQLVRQKSAHFFARLAFLRLVFGRVGAALLRAESSRSFALPKRRSSGGNISRFHTSVRIVELR